MDGQTGLIHSGADLGTDLCAVSDSGSLFQPAQPPEVMICTNGDPITGMPEPLAWAMLWRAVMVEHEEVRRDYP